jgi:RNA polymerase sigma-70 factor (ECF subfamily)
MRYLRWRWTREHFARQTENFLPALYRTARCLTRDPADAEDLVQDTYLKAYQAFEKTDVSSADACRAWLFRVMVNTYRDRYRRQQRSPEVQLFGADDATVDDLFDGAVSPEPDPEILLGRKHFSMAAQVAMAALAPEVRLVVSLFLVEGLAYKEIADIVGCPIGTVMSRLARGRRILQQHLKEYRHIPEKPRHASRLWFSLTPSRAMESADGA